MTYVAPYSPSLKDWQRQVSGASNLATGWLTGVPVKDFGSFGISSLANITLSNSQTLSGEGQIVTADLGSTNAVVLRDYGARLNGLYFSGGTNASESLIRVKVSRYASITNITAVNCGPKFIRLVPDTPASETVAVPIITNCDAEDITGTGIDIGSSVSEIRAVNVHLYGKLTNSTGGQRPSFTTVGWRQNTPVVAGIAVGGHQIANVNSITVNRGFHLTDAQLTKFSDCSADSCSDYGILLDGACQYIDFADTFVGTTRGVKVMGTCSDIHFDGLRTLLTGSIPPWGSTDFYNSVGTFYDLEVRDTAQVKVSNWVGPKRIAVDSTAKLVVTGGHTFHGRNTGTVGAGMTGYMAEWGTTSSESDAVWRAPYDCYILRLCPASTVAPGAGQSFTYTARVNGADTSLSSVVSGASSFGNVDSWSGSLISANKGDSLAIKLVTSASAAAATHQCQLQIASR